MSFGLYRGRRSIDAAHSPHHPRPADHWRWLLGPLALGLRGLVAPRDRAADHLASLVDRVSAVTATSHVSSSMQSLGGMPAIDKLFEVFHSRVHTDGS